MYAGSAEGITHMKLAQRVSKIRPSATLAINARAKALKKEGVHVVNFGVGEPDFATPEHIQEAAIKALHDGQTRYTPVSGIDELKDAVCKTIQNEYGLSYRRDNVLISCGGKHAIYNLFQVLLDPGDEVIIPSPYWVSYPDMVLLSDGVPVTVPCGEEHGFKLTAADLEKAITPKTRMLVLNSPSNPTGAHYTRKELKALAEVLIRHEEILILSDDIYYRILFNGSEWVNIAMIDERLKDRTFIVNGVSKSYAMTGWRIGYAVGDNKVIKAATDIQSQSTSNATSISQWASVEALNGPQSVVSDMVKTFDERRGYVLKRLAAIPGVTCPAPDGAFYVFPNFSAYYGKSIDGKAINNSLDLSEYLLDKAFVAAVPGSAFGEDHCIRFSYALSMEDIREGFDRIEKALKALA